MTQLLPSQLQDDAHARPLRDVEQMIQWFARGNKPAGTRLRVGMEHEKFGVLRSTARPIAFEGASGVEAILDGMAERFGYERVQEGGHTIALVKDGASVSLEPGGQLELSGAPQASMDDTEKELDLHLSHVRAVAEPLGVVFYGMGYRPYAMPDAVPRMPKARYRRMAQYMPGAGTRGLEMMLSTATVQANLDYTDEVDMGEKLRVALGVSGLITALFAASPYEGGRPCGFKSRRMLTWTDTDNTRAGLLRFALEREATFRDYANWALDVPLIFIRRGQEYSAPPAGTTLRTWMADGGRTLPAPVMGDFMDLLSTLFPDVRLKQYLELRTADAGDRTQLLALPALSKGILYAPGARARAWKLVERLSFAEHEQVKDAALRDGLDGRVGRFHLGEAAEELCRIAREGLEEQGLPGEARFILPMEERARARTALADLFLRHGGEPIDAALALARLC